MDVASTSLGVGGKGKRTRRRIPRTPRVGVASPTLPPVTYERTPGAASAPLPAVSASGGIYRRHEPAVSPLGGEDGLVRGYRPTLFVSAKVAQFAYFPQGQPERYDRVQKMIATTDQEGFGNCTNQGECEAVRPKEIKMTNIALMNRDFMVAAMTSGARQVG